jgi:hypothetical protein
LRNDYQALKAMLLQHLSKSPSVNCNATPDDDQMMRTYINSDALSLLNQDQYRPTEFSILDPIHNQWTTDPWASYLAPFDEPTVGDDTQSYNEFIEGSSSGISRCDREMDA